jgi:hypothetical protein
MGGGIRGGWGNKNGKKKEKRNGDGGLLVWWEKKGGGKRKKKLKGKKLNWFYLFVHFVGCKVKNCENLFRASL